ncbi:MAG: 2-phospho-L-lactate transferase [Nitrososphaerota archaeon]|nr:2-phospho-L-lactate transferase [Nitrososphaerota archaeon]
MKVVALAGGTGSAKLLRGLQAEIDEFTVVSNVGDNFWNHGLYVCPDIDIAVYTLAGTSDVAKGWGLRGDTFNVLAQLGKLGEETWFNLGDMDLATQIFRTEQLSKGRRLGDITTMLCDRLRVRQKVLPCTDDRLETYIDTHLGPMHLQDFWVKNHGEPEVTGVEYRGSETARAEYRVITAIEEADRVIFCPANPVTSILPILAVDGVKRALSSTKARRVAVSPIIGDAPVSGPAGKMLKAIGAGTDSSSVAGLYRGLVDVMVLDAADETRRRDIERHGIRAVSSSILMNDFESERRVARQALVA